MMKPIEQIFPVKNSYVNVNVADFDISVQYTRTARFGRFSFSFVIDISWSYGISNVWFQEWSDWKLWHDGTCVFSWTDLLFPAFI